MSKIVTSKAKVAKGFIPKCPEAQLFRQNNGTIKDASEDYDDVPIITKFISRSNNKLRQPCEVKSEQMNLVIKRRRKRAIKTRVVVIWDLDDNFLY